MGKFSLEIIETYLYTKKFIITNQETLEEYTCDVDISKYAEYCFFSSSALYNFIYDSINSIIKKNIAPNKSYKTQYYNIEYNIIENTINFSIDYKDNYDNTKNMYLVFNKKERSIEEDIKTLAQLNYWNTKQIEKINTVNIFMIVSLAVLLISKL